MKNFITALFLTVGFAVTAQVANITYVSVDRENSETFLELHQKFANLSISDDRKITGGGMFAHAFAGDYTFAIYDFYANEQDVSTYNTKWGKNKDFVEGIKNGSLKTLKESGLAVAAYASRHFYGSGADWQTYQVYNTWSDFAAYEEANLGGPMTEDDKKFWSAINSHSDEILTYIGGMDPETKVFSYSK